MIPTRHVFSNTTLSRKSPCLDFDHEAVTVLGCTPILINRVLGGPSVLSRPLLPRALPDHESEQYCLAHLATDTS